MTAKAAFAIHAKVRPPPGREANRDGLIMLRLLVAKFVKNNHQFTLALRLESFKDLKAVDTMHFGKD